MKNDFYITGESYAGHYIPAFAARVHKGNKAKEGLHINLKVPHFPSYWIFISLFTCLYFIESIWTGFCHWEWAYGSQNTIRCVYWLCIGHGISFEVWSWSYQQNTSSLWSCNKPLWYIILFPVYYLSFLHINWLIRALPGWKRKGKGTDEVIGCSLTTANQFSVLCFLLSFSVCFYPFRYWWENLLLGCLFCLQFYILCCSCTCWGWHQCKLSATSVCVPIFY